MFRMLNDLWRCDDCSIAAPALRRVLTPLFGIGDTLWHVHPIAIQARLSPTALAGWAVSGANSASARSLPGGCAAFAGAPAAPVERRPGPVLGRSASSSRR